MNAKLQKREEAAGRIIAVLAAVMISTIVLVGVLVGMFGVCGLN